ncbi:MAG: hypothetical protein US56_C0012G0003 [Candidatus Moranbacteria bacterium GW2011_GWF2_37_7]|nr:MAG: hypothetical protein US56_C0012G0003 [Candidatus Moranbacteria bacterium GW2011_GWF2_37_7]
MNPIQKFLWTVGLLILALIPTWFFLGFRSLLAPSGFFQNLFVFGLGFYFLGVIQLILLIIWLIFAFHICTD